LNDDEITSPCVVLTTYEMALKDFATLQRIPRRWAYLVVDEAHRLKNWDSKLVQVLRALQPRRRLLLTGTPLQNNLSELWSLLNFLLPSIFDDVYNFLEWFNAPFDLDASASSTDVTLSDEEHSVVIERLHAVLRPFLLRRVKADVLQSLPSKVERVVRCPLSPLQVALYKRIRCVATTLCSNA
jgi:ATP-dependent helicase STH1/SNF2